MNKYVIPAILASIILVLGFSVFAPVEKASTVHNDIISDIRAIGDALCDDLEDPFNFEGYDPDTGNCVSGIESG